MSNKNRILASLLVLGVIFCAPFNAQSQDKEKYRPNFHFTPAAKWMNDPNGMVYFEGEYHLFYQYYPDSTIWGPMHWGHAISKDLTHWDRLPVALYPDSLGYIFSGSAVMDLNNTSGIGTKENPAMIAIFTYHNPIMERAKEKTFQYQGIAYSLDKGRTWKKYFKNPVIKNPGLPDFRDPKVFWNKADAKWNMVLAAGDRVKFFSSPNLLDWTFESDFGVTIGAHGGVWECPDLFPLKIGNTNDTKWVLLVSIGNGGPNGGSATQYFIGDFNGHGFKASDNHIRWVDYGKDNYAGVTWSNIPSQDSRTLFLGWMSNWQYATIVPTQTWRSAMTFPRELKLLKENEELILTSQPVKEIVALRNKEVQFKNKHLKGEYEISDLGSYEKNSVELILTFTIPITHTNEVVEKFGLRLSNKQNEEILIGYNMNKKQLYVNRTKSGITNFSQEFPGEITAPCKLEKNKLKMHILIDEASIEIFGQEGKTVLTNIFFPHEKYDQISFFAHHGEVILSDFKIWRINSIW